MNLTTLVEKLRIKLAMLFTKLVILLLPNRYRPELDRTPPKLPRHLVDLATRPLPDRKVDGPLRSRYIPGSYLDQPPRPVPQTRVDVPVLTKEQVAKMMTDETGVPFKLDKKLVEAMTSPLPDRKIFRPRPLAEDPKIDRDELEKALRDTAQDLDDE